MITLQFKVVEVRDELGTFWRVVNHDGGPVLTTSDKVEAENLAYTFNRIFEELNASVKKGGLLTLRLVKNDFEDEEDTVPDFFETPTFEWALCLDCFGERCIHCLHQGRVRVEANNEKPVRR